MFFALLLADIIALIMLKLAVVLKTVVIVCGIVFAVMALVFFFGHNARQRIRKREENAKVRIAELQDQIKDTLKKKDEPAK